MATAEILKPFGSAFLPITDRKTCPRSSLTHRLVEIQVNMWMLSPRPCTARRPSKFTSLGRPFPGFAETVDQLAPPLVDRVTTPLSEIA